jgi:hypothetical protein
MSIKEFDLKGGEDQKVASGSFKPIFIAMTWHHHAVPLRGGTGFRLSPE